jgi:hypothetical protein
VTAPENVIVSLPPPAVQSAFVAASLFALTIASRKEHAPLTPTTSALVVTVKVAACAGLTGNAITTKIAIKNADEILDSH